MSSVIRQFNEFQIEDMINPTFITLCSDHLEMQAGELQMRGQPSPKLQQKETVSASIKGTDKQTH